MSESPSVVSYGGLIYLFHQGYGDDGQLWYNTSPDGQTWNGDQQVPDTGMSESPSAVLDGALYVFHQGSGEDGQLWYNTFDGQTWLGDRQVQNTGMSASPFAVVG